MKKLLNKKGMTLVEVIVVLVILAILAAVLVPSMIGWIDKAKEKTGMAEARAVYLAAQTIASEKYATDGTATLADDADAILLLAGVEGGTLTALTATGGVVSALAFEADNGKTYTYASGAWEIS